MCANAGDLRAFLSRRQGSNDDGDNNNNTNKDNGNTGTTNSVLPLSFDHKPENDVELSRVEKDGGFVMVGRVDGILAVSRSFGDFAHKAGDNDHAAMTSRGMQGKDCRVTVHPDIIVHARQPSKDEFAVLACDGIWDRLSNQDCADLVHSLVHDEGEADVGLICEEIIDTALELDSRDNMTCCLVMFPGSNSMPTLHHQQQMGGKNSNYSSQLGGVMKRRLLRESKWGPNSTPARRAQERQDERKKKNQETLSTLQQQKTPKVLPKSQGRCRQQRVPQSLQLNCSSRERPGPLAPRYRSPSRERTSSSSSSSSLAAGSLVSQHRHQQGPNKGKEQKAPSNSSSQSLSASSRYRSPTRERTSSSSSSSSSLAAGSLDSQHRHQQGPNKGKKHKAPSSSSSQSLSLNSASRNNSGRARSKKSLRLQLSSGSKIGLDTYRQ